MKYLLAFFGWTIGLTIMPAIFLICGLFSFVIAILDAVNDKLHDGFIECGNLAFYLLEPLYSKKGMEDGTNVTTPFKDGSKRS